MRSLIIAAAAGVAAVALTPSAASADPHDGWRQLEEKRWECERDLRRADSRRQYFERLRECRREIARARRHLVREQYRAWDRNRDDDWDDDDWDD